MNIHTSHEQLIGKTPLVELKRIEKELELKAKLIVKLEAANPAGSAKDRAASRRSPRARRCCADGAFPPAREKKSSATGSTACAETKTGAGGQGPLRSRSR